MPASMMQSQGCPYAAALKQKQQQERVDQEPNGTSNDDYNDTVVDQSLVADLKELELAKAKCPAFSAAAAKAALSSSSSSTMSSCPFSQAKTPEELRETFLQLPPSNLEPNGLVYKSLEHFHSKRPTGGGGGTFVLFPGGCPVKNSLVLRDSTGAPISFHQAMEDYSLAAIMGRMAQEFESERRHRRSDDDSVESGSSAHGEEPEDHVAALLDSAEPPLSTTSVSTTTNHHHDAASIGESSTASSVAASAPPLSSSLSFSGGNSRPSLSEALKSGTAVSHEQAEDVHFVKNFIRGKIDRDLYSKLVVNLYHVYEALEQELDAHAPTQFATCHYPTELYRTESLKEDVDFWYTTTTTKTTASSQAFVPPPISPATRDYMDRIHYCATYKPLLLLSHAYTRYLGDLSGGKILARVARRALNLDKDGDGLAFYHFEHVTSAKKFKDLYRTALNELELTEVDITDLVHEANIAFGLNVRLFEELDVQGGVPGATVRPLDHVLNFEQLVRPKKEHGSEGAASEVKECPFAVGRIATAAKLASHHGGSTSMAAHATTNIQPHDVAAGGPTSGGRCPWPFILLHDPAAGFQCWQTWVVLGLLLSYTYSQYIS
jgi:heme oxygenase